MTRTYVIRKMSTGEVLGKVRTSSESRACRLGSRRYNCLVTARAQVQA